MKSIFITIKKKNYSRMRQKDYIILQGILSTHFLPYLANFQKQKNEES